MCWQGACRRHGHGAGVVAMLRLLGVYVLASDGRCEGWVSIVSVLVGGVGSRLRQSGHVLREVYGGPINGACSNAPVPFMVH